MQEQWSKPSLKVVRLNNLTENHPEVLHNHQLDHLNKGDNKYAPVVEGDLILGKLVLLKMQLVISVTVVSSIPDSLTVHVITTQQ